MAKAISRRGAEAQRRRERQPQLLDAKNAKNRNGKDLEQPPTQMRAVLDSRLTGWSSFKRWLLSFFAHLRVLRVSLLLFSAALRLCESPQLTADLARGLPFGTYALS
jgi:hypothetical protein